jgi:hypothetical protein
LATPMECLQNTQIVFQSNMVAKVTCKASMFAAACRPAGVIKSCMAGNSRCRHPRINLMTYMQLHAQR